MDEIRGNQLDVDKMSYDEVLNAVLELESGLMDSVIKSKPIKN